MDGNRKASRHLRARKHNRRVFQDNGQTKRLFTPEIKKYLKAWLVRRRKNPYPNRTEKKELSMRTGLTYTQICNWFANWRRKLKNSCRNSQEGSWGILIKDYNHQAKGNVEQFSISSDDSIWDETNFSSDGVSYTNGMADHLTEVDHSYYSIPYYGAPGAINKESNPALLSKWLGTAARCMGKNNLPWSTCNMAWESTRRDVSKRHRLELDAAEALTSLGAWQPQQQFSIPGH